MSREKKPVIKSMSRITDSVNSLIVSIVFRKIKILPFGSR